MICASKPSNTFEHLLGASLHQNHNDFFESEGSRLLNQESGGLLGGKLTYELAYASWFISTSANHLNGKLAYSGFTQLGRKAITKTHFSLQDYGGDVYYKPKYINHLLSRVGLAKRQTMQLKFGTRYFDIQRNIESKDNISGLNERYQFLMMNLGIDWQYEISPTYKVVLGYWHGYAVQPKLTVDFLGRFDQVSHRLNQVESENLEGSIHYKMSPRYRLSVGVLYKQHNIDKSDEGVLTINGIKAGTFYQPPRQTTVLQSYISISYLF